MRPYSAAAIFFLCGLVACRSVDQNIDGREEFEHCTLDDPASWQLISPPLDAKEILALPLKDGTLGSELAPRGSNLNENHEHWFSSGDSRLAVCRHLAGLDSCYSNSTLAYLAKVAGKWVTPDGVLESICLVHERAR